MTTDRIRVAHVITRMIVGGAQETVLLAATLADRGRFEPVIVCGPQTGSEGSLHDQARRRGVELVVVPELVREIDPRRDARVIPALAALFRARRFDVVHTNSSKAGIVGRVAARRAHVRGVVHTVHGWPFHDHQSTAAATVWRLLERRTARLADRLVVVADADRDKGLAAGVGVASQYVTVRSGLELAGYGPDPAAADEVRSSLGIPVHAPVIGAVNRLSAQKDPLTLIDTFALVARTVPDAHFVVAGDGPLRAEVQSRVDAARLNDRVHLLGLRDDVPRLLTAFDVFVTTSRWEGLPRTVLAAMATGVPVVATPVDGILDVVVDGVTGVLAPVGRPDLLAVAAVRALRDGEQLAAQAGARVTEFGAEQMVRTLERLYEDVLA